MLLVRHLRVGAPPSALLQLLQQLLFACLSLLWQLQQLLQQLQKLRARGSAGWSARGGLLQQPQQLSSDSQAARRELHMLPLRHLSLGAPPDMLCARVWEGSRRGCGHWQEVLSLLLRSSVYLLYWLLSLLAGGAAVIGERCSIYC